MFCFLYPHHADPRTLGLYPWLEVLRDTERGFVCACCGVKQHPWRPMAWVPGGTAIDDPYPAVRLGWLAARHYGEPWTFRPWCASCAWKLCGRKMVRPRRWWEFWR